MNKTPETMPDSRTNDHGFSMRAVRAIVKVDGKASRAFGERRWIARCGYAGRGCQGVLGWFDNVRTQLDGAVPYENEFPTEDAWCLTPPADWSGYSGRPTTGYSLVKGKRAKNGDLIGRRPRPRGIEPFVDDPIAQYEDMIDQAAAAGDWAEAEQLRQEREATREEEAAWAIESDSVQPTSGKSRRITGQWPCPPCNVLCPSCKRWNAVPLPDADPPPARLTLDREYS